MIIADDWDHFDNITLHDVIGAGTHAQVSTSVAQYELAMGKWHRSKEKVAGKYPYGGYLTNKKWHLNEVNVNTKSNNVIILILIMTFKEFAKHLLHFQQV